MNHLERTRCFPTLSAAAKLALILALAVYALPLQFMVQHAQAAGVSRVLIVGDSAMQAGLGTALEQALEQGGKLKVQRFAQQSTGLARLDQFDWTAKLGELMKSFKPDLVIAEWGNNDTQALFGADGHMVAKFGTPEWDKGYGDRLRAVIGAVQKGGGKMAVIGLPNMRDRGTANQAQRINKTLEAVAKEKSAAFLPTWAMTSGADGKYLAAIQWNGKKRMMREGDGVHLSEDGAGYVTEKLMVELGQLYGIGK